MSVQEMLLAAKKEGKKLLAILIDPDRVNLNDSLWKSLEKADVILVGSSALLNGSTQETVSKLKAQLTQPIILFPGNSLQVCKEADAIFFLSLLSGRNPEYLIGQQVKGAPIVKKHGLESLPTAYMLIESGNITSAQYVSQTLPIPSNKSDIAVATALAGEMMGMKFFYLDGGSGAQQAVPKSMIQQVSQSIEGFVIVGGGIRHKAGIENAWSAGADMVVVGTIVEENPDFLS